MIIDITSLIVYRQYSLDTIREWLDDHVGAYLGPGNYMRIDETVPARISVLYIGEGWQIEAREIVDGYGKTIYYQIDIDNEKMATFFILKFL